MSASVATATIFRAIRPITSQQACFPRGRSRTPKPYYGAGVKLRLGNLVSLRYDVRGFAQNRITALEMTLGVGFNFGL